MAIEMLTRASILIFTDQLHYIYGHKTKVCLEQNISIGSFYASFHNFHNVSLYVKWAQKLVMKFLFC